MNNALSIDQINRTHSQTGNSFESILELTKERIVLRGDLPYATAKYQLEILNQLCEFPLGRFILERKGANGFWTDYMISYPNRGKISGLNIEGKPFNRIEYFLLNECPIILAHQERFAIFQNLIQKEIKEGAILASIPSGLMRDLLTLDFSGVDKYKLIGIDIDRESIELAKADAIDKGITNAEFFIEDAWKIKYSDLFDVITSSGLNVYESDNTKVLDLYKRFFNSLKPGGCLITSVLTFPPGEDVETDWNLDQIPQEALLLDRILHKDILDIKWRNFRKSNTIYEEFKKAGFSEISIYFDKSHIFPTVLARKAIHY